MLSVSPQVLSSYAARPQSVVYGLYCVCGGCASARGVQVRYIGITVNGVEFRLYQHLRESRQAPRRSLSKSRWIQKHGSENIRIVVIEEVPETKELNSREVYWISRYKTHRSKHGLNMTSGGDGVSGYEYTDEQRKAMSERAKGRKPSEAAILASRTRLGTKSPLATSDETTVEEMKRALWNGTPPSLVAKEFSVSPNFINHLNNGRTWSHVSWPIGPRQKTRTSELQSMKATGRTRSDATRRKLSEAISNSWTEFRKERQREILKENTGLSDWVRSAAGREANSRRNGKLSDDQVRLVRELHADGISNAEIGRRISATPTIVGRIVRGESYRFVR